ncbi:hypothetical protein D3C71_1680660 [compost metagenome]
MLFIDFITIIIRVIVAFFQTAFTNNRTYRKVIIKMMFIAIIEDSIYFSYMILLTLLLRESNRNKILFITFLDPGFSTINVERTIRIIYSPL